MRIGIDARFYGLWGKGLGRYTQKLIEHLEADDNGNEYVVFLRRENFDEYRPRNPRFRKVLAPYPWYGFSEQIRFPRLLARERLDVVHFPHFNVPLLYRKKFVVTIHDLILLHHPTFRNTTRSRLWYSLKFLAYRLIIAQAVRRANRVLTVSQFAQADLLKEYPSLAGKIRVTPEAADSYCHWSSPGDERKLFARLGLLRRGVSGRDILDTYFLYVGNAYPHKNLEFLVTEACAFPEYRFVLVGKSDFFYERLMRVAQAQGATNIIFAGFVTDDELGMLYRRACLYLFPSLYEGFGLPPLEAMNYGLPVLSSERASLPEVLGDAAAYFDPESPASFRESLKRLLGDPAEQTRLRQRGWQRIGRFSWAKLARDTLEVYRATQHQNTYVSGATQNK